MNKKIIMYIFVLLTIISITSAADTKLNNLNTPPDLTITSMNLNPGTSRDIYSFITDVNGDDVSCFYCIEANCYVSCKIYAPTTPGVHKINITLNDSKNISIKQISLFIPGEVPTNSGGSSIGGISSSKKSSDTDANTDVNSPSTKNPVNTQEMNQTNTTNLNGKGSDSNPRDENPNTKLEENEINKYSDNLNPIDILWSIIILGILGAIFFLADRHHEDKRKGKEKPVNHDDLF